MIVLVSMRLLSQQFVDFSVEFLILNAQYIYQYSYYNCLFYHLFYLTILLSIFDDLFDDFLILSTYKYLYKSFYADFVLLSFVCRFLTILLSISYIRYFSNKS